MTHEPRKPSDDFPPVGWRGLAKWQDGCWRETTRQSDRWFLLTGLVDHELEMPDLVCPLPGESWPGEEPLWPATPEPLWLDDTELDAAAEALDRWADELDEHARDPDFQDSARAIAARFRRIVEAARADEVRHHGGNACSRCGGSGRLVMGRPHPTMPGRSAWPLDDPVCPDCRGEGRSPTTICSEVKF